MKKIIALVLFVFASLIVYAAGADIISRQQAIDVALQQTNGVLLDVEFDTYRRSLVYEVEVLDNTGYESNIVVDAVTGAVVRQNRESIRREKADILRQTKISYDAAEKIAVGGLAGSMAINFELDVRGGLPVYDVDLVDSRGVEYEAMVNAVDGSLITVRQDETIIRTPQISKADAERIALESTNGTLLYTTLDEDDRRVHYEVKVISPDARIFEVKVDGMTGRILRTEIDN